VRSGLRGCGEVLPDLERLRRAVVGGSVDLYQHWPMVIRSLQVEAGHWLMDGFVGGENL
jgi:hypothetical protein